MASAQKSKSKLQPDWSIKNEKNGPIRFHFFPIFIFRRHRLFSYSVEFLEIRNDEIVQHTAAVVAILAVQIVIMLSLSEA